MSLAVRVEPATAFTPRRIVPPPRPRRSLDFVRAAVGNAIAVIPEAAYTDAVVHQRVLGRDIYFVSAPELVETILVDAVDRTPRGSDRLLRPAIGNSLLTAEGEDWRWKRRLAAPAFRPRALMRHVPAMAGPFAELAAAWRTPAPARRTVHTAMARATFQVVFRTLFAGHELIDQDRLGAALDDYFGAIGWAIAYTILNVPEWLPRPGAGRMRRSARAMRDAVADYVGRRRPGERQGLADELLDLHDDRTGRGLSPEDRIDMLLTLIAAGHETTANAMTWTLMLLARQPERQAELAEVVDRVVGAADIAEEHLAGLKPLERFIEESMRLFPPVAMMSRRTTAPLRLGEHLLPADVGISIPIYAIHRHQGLWAEPHRFDPDRFLPEARRDRPRCAYLPFGAGPKVCIGGTFAMLEMVAGLAALLRALRLAPDGETPEPVQRITLRPRGGLTLMVAAR